MNRGQYPRRNVSVLGPGRGFDLLIGCSDRWDAGGGEDIVSSRAVERTGGRNMRLAEHMRRWSSFEPQARGSPDFEKQK